MSNPYNNYQYPPDQYNHPQNNNYPPPPQDDYPQQQSYNQNYSNQGNYYDGGQQQQQSHYGGGRGRGAGGDFRDNRRDNRGGDRRGGPPGGSDYRKRSRSRERGGPSGDFSRRDDRRRDERPERREDRREDVKREDKSKSPPPRERRRKRQSLWDQAPTSFDTAGAQTPSALPAAALNPHQNRQARRLYVGNIPLTVSDVELAEFINTAMFHAKATKGNNSTPVVAVQMNRDKNFAFVEFTCMEDASAGMGFDGITLQGHALKVRRPKDYKAVVEDKAAPVQLSNIVSTNVQEGPHKIFAGGLPAYLDEEQVKQLVSAFGQLKSFNLVKDNNTGQSKGFAFFDYLDAGVTDRACQGLNGMKIGEKTILVQRANVGAKHIPLPNPDQESIITNPAAYHLLNLQMPIAAAVALMGLSITDPGSPTRILVLMNLVSDNDLFNEEEYQDILEDIRDEMKKFGTVLSITMPRPPKPVPKEERDSYIMDPVPALPSQVNYGVGKIYIEFKRKEEAAAAQKALATRKFNGRAVLTGYLSEDRYAKKDFRPDPAEEEKIAEKFHVAQSKKELEEIQKIRQALQEDIDEMEAMEKLNQQNQAEKEAANAT